LSFTWHGVNVPAGGEVKKTVIVRFGDFETSHVTLAVTPLTGTFYFKTQIAFEGLANAAPLPTGSGVQLFLVVDGKEDKLIPIGRNLYWLGAPFTLAIVPEELGLLEGTHRLAFYAVDEDGDVSDATVATLTVSRTEISPSGEPEAQKSSSVAGPVVGSIVGVLAVAGAVGGFLWWRKNRIAADKKEYIINGKQEV
jgi:hypothetical protein